MEIDLLGSTFYRWRMSCLVTGFGIKCPEFSVSIMRVSQSVLHLHFSFLVCNTKPNADK
jgi:hypothetical protein